MKREGDGWREKEEEGETEERQQRREREKGIRGSNVVGENREIERKVRVKKSLDEGMKALPPHLFNKSRNRFSQQSLQI